jgi:murein DD-endopeptidase MepM/ murein hydrolase activator NlpD
MSSGSVQSHAADDHHDAVQADHHRHGRRHSHHNHRRAEHPGAGERPRSPEAAPPRAGKRRPKDRSAFTFGHGNRQFRIGPVAFWTVVGTLVIMAGWSVVTATYFAFQDDVLARMIARQTEMQFAYEDRIADMRAQVDRVTSRQLLDQEQLEQKLDQIVRRQSLLEQRATAMGTVADPSVTGSLRPPRAGQPAGPPKPSPISAPAPSGAPAARDVRAQNGAGGGFTLAGISKPAPRGTVDAPRGTVDSVLARLQESLDRVEGRQVNTLASLEESYEAKARRMRAVLADVGLDAAKHANTATGGPFVSYHLTSNAGPFEKQVYRINVARAQAERLSSTVGAVPLRKPVEGEIDTSSSFGVRIDPFLARPAMHTGLDFRGDTGEAIRVTAGGTVVSAGWSGGYGRMVEVDHGNGLSTRYGHLSEIEVKVGQTVKAGQTVGRMGSTGRSTGPHLHYETRIDGEAVDPQRFLHAGAKFGLM